MTQPAFIRSNAELERACAGWLEADAIGLDTEFERTRTYYSRPALVQVCGDDGISLIDPLAVDDFTALAGVLRHPGVIKVMHASEGDSEVLEQLCAVDPEPVFDTQMAAAFAGHGYSLGYRNLAKALLDVELAKDETRSDWMRRPLSAAQVTYAALDVAHLLPMYRRLRSELAALGRDDWLAEEVQRIRQRRAADRDPLRAYLRIRNSRRMSPVELARLRALAAWRETEARRRDLPRQRVVKDDALVALARAPPASPAGLADIPELPAGCATRYGPVLLDVMAPVVECADLPEAPGVLLDRRLTPWLKRLKHVVQVEADALAIPAPLLVQARTLESLVANCAAGSLSLPDELRGWREPVIGAPLLDALRRMQAG